MTMKISIHQGEFKIKMPSLSSQNYYNMVTSAEEVEWNEELQGWIPADESRVCCRALLQIIRAAGGCTTAPLYCATCCTIRSRNRSHPVKISSLATISRLWIFLFFSDLRLKRFFILYFTTIFKPGKSIQGFSFVKLVYMYTVDLFQMGHRARF